MDRHCYYAWVDRSGLLQDYLGSGRIFRRATPDDVSRSEREKARGNPSGGFVVDWDGVAVEPIARQL